MGCGCDKPKCNKGDTCGISPAVLQINNPSECVLFHKTIIPASMGDETTIPPTPGAYRNMIVYYEASGAVYMYDSDGMPTPISYTDYLRLLNKPSINGVVLVGNKTLTDLGIDIYDAALTVKQGDTVLGTFSANASQDVEINIPTSSGDDTIRLTVSYGDGSWDDGDMPGLNIDFSPDAANGSWIDGRIIPSPTFTDATTSTSYTTEEVYNLLEDGKKIIFDALPLGWHISDGNRTVQLVDGVPIGSKVSYGNDTVAYFGGAVCSTINYSLTTTFGVAVLKHKDLSDNTIYDLITQGVSYMSAPI